MARRDRLDAVQVLEARLLEAQLAVLLDQPLALALHLLRRDAGLAHLEVRPRVEHGAAHEHRDAQQQPDDVAVGPGIALADDLGVVEPHATSRSVCAVGMLSITRSFALRARGLRRISSSPGRIGFFVSSR